MKQRHWVSERAAVGPTPHSTAGKADQDSPFAISQILPGLTTLPSPHSCRVSHNPSGISSCQEKWSPRQVGLFPSGRLEKEGEGAASLALPRGLSGSQVREVKLDMGTFKKQPCLRTLERRPRGTMPRSPRGLYPASCIFTLGTTCSSFWKNLGLCECVRGVVGGLQSRTSPVRRTREEPEQQSEKQQEGLSLSWGL